LIRATTGYDQTNPRLSVEFNVRGEQLEATVRTLPANAYGARSRLFLFEHAFRIDRDYVRG
jgi:hypothetical protein